EYSLWLAARPFNPPANRRRGKKEKGESPHGSSPLVLSLPPVYSCLSSLVTCGHQQDFLGRHRRELFFSLLRQLGRAHAGHSFQASGCKCVPGHFVSEQITPAPGYSIKRAVREPLLVRVGKSALSY